MSGAHEGAAHEPPDATARALADTVRRLQRAAAQQHAEARTRAVVDLATGILAERLGLLPAEAAARLARLAREAGVPVAALAADIAGQSAAPPPVPGAPPDAAQEPAPAVTQDVTPAVTPALAAVEDLQHAVDTVFDQAGPAHGAHAVAVWQRLPGGALALAAHIGLSAAEAAAWSRVPPGVATPAQRAVEDGTDLWPGDPRTVGPSVGTGSARAVLPLLGDGRCRGALEILWPAPGPDLGGPERRRLGAVADLCATLLADSHPHGQASTPPPASADEAAALVDALLTPALLLEPVLREGRVADFTLLRVNARFRDPRGRPREALEGASLLETYPVACATGLLDRLLRVHTTGIPLVGEHVRLVFKDGEFAGPDTVLLAVAPLGGRLLVSWQPESLMARGDEQSTLLRQAQRLARVAGFEEQLADGRIRWSEGLHELYGLAPDAAPVPLDRLARHTHPDDEPAIRRLLDTVRHRHRTASAVFRLARPDGTHRYTRVIAEPVLDTHGRLIAVRGAYHDVSAQHWTEVALGATRERLADSEQETAESERLALRLQQAILPTAPPPLGATGLHAAARYRPAAKRDRVGGDWYDVLLLPDKRVLLAVGDVAGHGVGAATGMVALRHALRGLAVTGAGPGRLLEWANTVALREPGQVTATAVCVLLDPAGGALRWARAGHLPPIRLAAGSAEVLPMPHGVLLGALEDARYEEHTAHLAPGDVLLLYTDGLVERRDRPVEDSVDQLIRAAGAPGPDLEDYLDRLLELSPADTEDDTCLIAVQVD
ncbi:serine phosphatase RsbU (regulator of sigma subunit) [Streptomyces sp. 1114.5]|uniref:SpoIIE family protein phosphatase n=1 Tax=unclassified Streptomyces TaxID=2593676 RepID=UPI000BCAD91F|nr:MULTISPECIES: SpoIIE family protein phosphatase [unclassified Streptomyces]RKT09437.1 serine phosphatase RsbU (regulator of sigma subunit) [Streptomyces sp. 1114.5]SOB88558.1 Serine phosphatase RsbU, regulator of sigma subunit [Streptomyces sp. 1331.2]